MSVDSQTYAAYESVPDALLIVGRDGPIVFANRHAERLFGYEPGQLVGVEIEALLPEQYRQRHAKLRAEFSVDPAVRPMGYGRELFARSSDGREFPVEIGIGPADREERAVAVIRDISEQVLTRKKLERAMTELARSKDRLQAEADYLREDLEREQELTEIVGRSEAMVATLEKVEQAAKTDATVLLLGETGTGKELLAHALHSRSNRTKKPLVKIDCATLPSGLVESELFGHEKGAFTGAHEKKVGRFELADGGTVFLDEIGELSLELQAKLLRVIQEGEFQRLGAKREKKIDVRFIAATNRDLREEMRERRFRSDLYYRLSVFPIESPPLRDRREDIPLLASYFLSRFQATVGKRIDTIAKSSMEALVAYSWPGNVRELQNVIERSAILCSGDTLIVREVLGDFGSPDRESASSLTQELEDIERANILRALEGSDWKVKGDGNAASRLGIKPSTLRSRMKRLGIERS
ncbi:MAG: sigma 54-interacting transcriptional regulator [Deltaproteobacteria bacterium]|nr:sigma 54-interacting transcriptional regulator [Deltaproteobacteria bacterium]